MATQAYYDWVADGRPMRLATPVAEYRAALLTVGFAPGGVGTIGDEAHLTASRPEDHCPFSATGWPNPSPYPYVHALDLSGSGPGGMDLPAAASHWIDSARSGVTPWVKYIVWQGQRYDVRNGWTPVGASGHYDHVHVSMRTDYTLTSIGAWTVTPGGGNDMEQAEKLLRDTGNPDREIADTLGDLQNLRNWAVSAPGAKLTQPPGPGSVADIILQAALRQSAQVDPVVLAQALATQAGFVDAIATALAAKLGMIPTAREIGKAVGELVWHGKAE